jgi:hypothetical protein
VRLDALVGCGDVCVRNHKWGQSNFTEL